MPNSLSPNPASSPAAASAEFVLTVRAQPREPVDHVFSRLATRLRECGGTMLALFLYGDVAARESTTRVLRRHLGPIDFPVLWVEGRSCNGALVSGVQAFAISGLEIERVLVNGRVVATTYCDGDARHCLVAGISPDDPAASEAGQTESTFENLRHALSQTGFDIADLARTWFYNRRLLDWYPEFNRVRNRYYAERPFHSGAVPASTGVEGANPAGAALALAAWAVQPINESAVVRPVVSPLQCPAPQYGSAFSRAMEITSRGTRRLLVSGTASISPSGESVWLGDITKQIETTMDVIHAILRSRDMAWADLSRATAYFKYPLDSAAFVEWQRRHGVAINAVDVHCDICRDDLLFELELDATRRE